MTIILMALQKESNGLIEKTAAQANIPVYFTGIGLIAAAQKVTEIICKYQPSHILNLGTAGSRTIPVGSLVECAKFSNRSADQLPLLRYSVSVETITDLVKTDCGSADYIDMSDSADDHGALDMEAYAMAVVCKKMKVKFSSIKYITDDSKTDFTNQWNAQLNISAFNLQKMLEKLIQTKVIG